MWNPTTSAHHSRAQLRYGSDLTDAEWHLMEPYLPAPCQRGRRRCWPMREIVEAIFYLLRAGCPWRLLPDSFPPWRTVYRWFCALRDDGVSELLHAKWQHVNLERRVWLIPTSKTGKSRHVPLSQAAIEVIEQVPLFTDCPYLLPNPDTLQPFVTLKHGWQAARDEAHLPDLRIHDLRHSFASFAVNAGIDLFAVGKVVGHADHKSTMRYSHLANDTLMAAFEAGAKKMGNLVN